jgi:hypothetical protein
VSALNAADNPKIGSAGSWGNTSNMMFLNVKLVA